MPELTDNINLFQPTGFRLLISRKNFPNLQFFAQTVNHPSVTLNSTEVAFPRANIPYPGDKVSFGDLTATILLDEDLNGYQEMYNWMVRLVNEEFVSAYDATVDSGIEPTFNDITVTALTSHNNINKSIRYVDAVPTTLGDIQFEANNAGVEYITFPVSFRFSYFVIN